MAVLPKSVNNWCAESLEHLTQRNPEAYKSALGLCCSEGKLSCSEEFYQFLLLIRVGKLQQQVF